ncbi:3-deoxy-D-manno-octulosonic-acid transferase [compost metagenome]
MAQGGAALVADAAALGDKVSELLSDGGARRQMGEQARAVVLRNQGALARTLSHCLASLEND